MAVRGAAPVPWDKLAPVVTGLIGDLLSQGFTGPFSVADGRPVHAAGGSEAQELAFVLANALAYLRALEDHGIELETARGLIFFRLAADQDQFLTIAKFRSVRKLWARNRGSLRACITACLRHRRDGVADDDQARCPREYRAWHNSGTRYGSRRRRCDNGAPLHRGARAPRRVRAPHRPQHATILIEEANIHRVADPAAGSGAIEALTDRLCAAAWTLFQEIERGGGAAKALESGLIQRAVAKVRAERETNVARRKDSLVGTSDFPDLTEAPVVVLGRRSEIAR